LSARPEFNHTDWGATLWLVAVTLEIVAFLLGGINFLTTTMNSRAPGMTMWDIPIIVWFINIASVLFMASVGPLVAGAVMLFMDQRIGTSFFVPSGGGDPILWQHLFWFFGHPEVYILIIPAFGIISIIISSSYQKIIFGNQSMIFAMSCISLLGSVVWGHHMYTVGLETDTRAYFTGVTILISLPTGTKI